MSDPIILFDGWCVLCSRAVRFILDHEKEPVFRFAPLDSAAGRRYLSEIPDSDKIDSVVVVTGIEKEVLIKGAAVVFIVRYLRPPWSWLRILRIFPGAAVDRVYDLIAGHRYRIWGKYDSCVIPDRLIPERLEED